MAVLTTTKAAAKNPASREKNNVRMSRIMRLRTAAAKPPGTVLAGPNFPSFAGRSRGFRTMYFVRGIDILFRAKQPFIEPEGIPPRFLLKRFCN
jgi:hypothetical protein